jgi:hypothetical protein
MSAGVVHHGITMGMIAPQSTEYEAVPATYTTDRVCRAVSTCQPGMIVCTVLCIVLLLTMHAHAGSKQTQAPTQTSDRVCQQCSAGTIDDDIDPTTECVACTAGTYTAAGTFGNCSSYQCAPGMCL